VASQSEFDTVKELEQKLESAHSDLKLVRSLFRDHVQSGFVSRFVESELYNIKDNPDHLVRRNAGQVSFTLINTVDFDYTIKLVPPFAGRPHAVKWLGEQQILSVQGEGGALVRRLTVPHDINDFLAGLLIEEIEMVYLNEREFLESPSPNNILDIYEIKEPFDGYRIFMLSSALVHEAIELQRETNWKWWKKEKSIDDQKIQEEIIDIWHFLLQLTIEAGIDSKKLMEIYLKKNKENLNRQEKGY